MSFQLPYELSNLIADYTIGKSSYEPSVLEQVRNQAKIKRSEQELLNKIQSTHRHYETLKVLGHFKKGDEENLTRNSWFKSQDLQISADHPTQIAIRNVSQIINYENDRINQLKQTIKELKQPQNWATRSNIHDVFS